jgi:hypothetical protein
MRNGLRAAIVKDLEVLAREASDYVSFVVLHSEWNIYESGVRADLKHPLGQVLRRLSVEATSHRNHKQRLLRDRHNRLSGLKVLFVGLKPTSLAFSRRAVVL